MAGRAKTPLWDRISGLFRKERTPAPGRRATAENPRPAGTPPPPPATGEPQSQDSSRLSSHASFEKKLSRLIAQNGNAPVVSGRVHLLNLDMVRERLGPRWERLAERVHATIRRTLDQRLGERDLYTRYEDDCYLIAFADASDEQAKLKCAMIGEEVMQKLFGEAEADKIGDLGIRTVVASTDGSLVSEQMDRGEALLELVGKAEHHTIGADVPGAGAEAPKESGLDLREVEQLLGHAETMLSRSEAGGHAKQEIGESLDRMRELAHLLKNLERTLLDRENMWLSKESSRAEPDPKWEPIRKLQGTVGDLVARSERQIDALQEAWAERLDLPPLDENLAIRCSYMPIWNAPRETIAIYHCHGSLVNGEAKLSAAQVDRHKVPAEVAAVLDRMLLRQVRTDMSALPGGTGGVICVPVHYPTLERTGSRDNYLMVCHSLPEESRRSLLWEIVDAPLGSWRNGTASAAALLRRVGKTVFLRVDPSDPEFWNSASAGESLRPRGIYAIGFDMRSLSRRASELEELRMLERFAEAAEALGVKCYVLGLDRFSFSIAAIAAGFEFLGGECLALPVDRPTGVQAASLESIWDHGLEGLRDTA